MGHDTAAPICSHCARAGPAHACRACGALYCGAACQRAAWTAGVHAPLCALRQHKHRVHGERLFGAPTDALVGAPREGEGELWGRTLLPALRAARERAEQDEKRDGGWVATRVLLALVPFSAVEAARRALATQFQTGVLEQRMRAPGEAEWRLRAPEFEDPPSASESDDDDDDDDDDAMDTSDGPAAAAAARRGTKRARPLGFERPDERLLKRLRTALLEEARLRGSADDENRDIPAGERFLPVELIVLMTEPSSTLGSAGLSALDVLRLFETSRIYARYARSDYLWAALFTRDYLNAMRLNGHAVEADMWQAELTALQRARREQTRAHAEQRDPADLDAAARAWITDPELARVRDVRDLYMLALERTLALLVPLVVIDWSRVGQWQMPHAMALGVLLGVQDARSDSPTGLRVLGSLAASPSAGQPYTDLVPRRKRTRHENELRFNSYVSPAEFDTAVHDALQEAARASAARVRTQNAFLRSLDYSERIVVGSAANVRPTRELVSALRGFYLAHSGETPIAVGQSSFVHVDLGHRTVGWKPPDQQAGDWGLTTQQTSPIVMVQTRYVNLYNLSLSEDSLTSVVLYAGLLANVSTPDADLPYTYEPPQSTSDRSMEDLAWKREVMGKLVSVETAAYPGVGILDVLASRAPFLAVKVDRGVTRLTQSAHPSTDDLWNRVIRSRAGRAAQLSQAFYTWLNRGPPDQRALVRRGDETKRAFAARKRKERERAGSVRAAARDPALRRAFLRAGVPGVWPILNTYSDGMHLSDGFRTTTRGPLFATDAKVPEKRALVDRILRVLWRDGRTRLATFMRDLEAAFLMEK